MATTCDTKLSMKLLIDTKAGKVLFAEADKDCVDFLFHILSLPAGTVISLLKEKGMSGSLPNLYESVENLKDTYIQSNQCKDILLKPKSSVGISPVPFLLLDGHVTTREKTFYGCSYSSSHLTVSDDPTALCTICNHTMSDKLVYAAPRVAGGAVEAKGKGGFVKDVVTYMVADDLVVKPMSTISCIALLNKFNVRDVGVLEEEVVSFGVEEALELLKASLESKTVLTSVFMSRREKAEK
ncbi:uncharacterized protein [Solanum lycopersicum]|uniref:DUF674 domain-containing protein n=2 Tax=Solanum subgen. Lycopersicon TaxID=49274 RepID=A0A3Q7H156_SOLLC|nr:uncharacterized protein LOC101254212 [Solanum lycopersicum]XP_015077812.1 uncharacterized protein LOC107021631 [Solanum pennellii]XP_015077813.1 uncharacterized protein LOC107021631 [Solanum pennellii]XP_015077814.1 uncharacterized protein LOC107021631 [Solanum pennellii]